MAVNGYNGFNDFFGTMLEAEPQTAYMGQIGSQQYRGTSPMQQRAADYWRNQYSDVYSQYLGQRGQELAQRKDPSQWTTFSDYLEQFPFTQRYTSLSPYQRGVSNRRFAPSTRHIFF